MKYDSGFKLKAVAFYENINNYAATRKFGIIKKVSVQLEKEPTLST